jgi:hypothetical protein
MIITIMIMIIMITMIMITINSIIVIARYTELKTYILLSKSPTRKRLTFYVL